MALSQSSKRFCIIGAGASGLAAVKTFKERRIPFDCFERQGEIGGIWNLDSPHAVYEATYFNSSRRLSRYTDFPMPDDYPLYMSRAQAQAYLQAYGRAFGLYDHVKFDAEIERLERTEKQWRVTIAGEGKPRIYDGVVIANGHHWDKKIPDYLGDFDGEIVHSHDVKRRDQLKNKRVVVVGVGNSGADIVCDAAIDSTRAIHSMRRSVYFFPKLIFGIPTDVFIDLTSRWPVPRAILRWLYTMGLRVMFGPHERYGLPKPDHKLFEAHPTAASTYLDHIAHGRIAPKPAVERFEGSRVIFEDGSVEEADLVIYATGFRVSFPFMDSNTILHPDGRSRLFLHAFHRNLDNLFVVGLMEPAEGGVWQLVDYQAQLIASFIVACERDGEKARWFRKLKAEASPDVGHGIAYHDTAWHKFEVQHYRYRAYMKRLIDKFGECSKISYSLETAARTNDRQLEGKPLSLAS